MELRTELVPPALDESMVARLTKLAEEIDCGHPEQTLSQLAEFNREAMTELEFIDFQGVYGGQAHDTWVRKVLAKPYELRVADVTKQELVELARRVMEGDGADHEVEFWLSMLEINIPNDRISDLIFWPDEYFDDVNYSQELSPEQVVEIAFKDGEAAQ
ncbi:MULTISPECIES: hypothetical protein [unclassified Pseudomonas]|uniref:hypothetical protein n=1 Tax=unclassified Pseudomonas TaxID=196821 RepID=UPI00215E345A|nr:MULTISPECIES: hypothetical protein [unclassified Pseudomonas]UVM48251.1 hypothetical protein LOY38_17780 [Pseudomonas sp. B21-015]WPN55928.1 hypothetical protein QMK51_17330 [Pseudomonas sp. P9_31]